MIHPLIIKESSTRLTITGDQYKKLVKKPKAILWCRDGMYGMVPIEVVKNAISLLRTINLYETSYRRKYELTFFWNETVEIPPATGRSMEKYNGSDQQGGGDPADNSDDNKKKADI